MNRTNAPRRWVALVGAIATLVTGLVGVQTALSAPASAVSSDSFQAGNIISDQNFFDPNAMSADQIQAFLNSEIHGCTTGNCLNVLTVATTSRAASYTTAGNLICQPYAGSASESAASVIYKVQQACSVSAKAILVTLQKEEVLVTKTAVTAATLSRAMGYGCPDSANGACDTLYYGFYNQVYLAARELRRYGTPTVAGNYQPGVHFIQYTPDSTDCPGAKFGSNVNILNRATAALYNYTPYQPNAAALANINGTGDICSSYGNRNFWRYYNSWFGDPTVAAGTPEADLTSVTTAPSSLTVAGWAVDPDAPAGSVPVSVQIDQNWYALSANIPGADLSAQYAGAGGSHYFTGTYAASPGNHTLCIYLVNVGGAGGQGSVGCQVVAVPSAPAPVGALTATASPGLVSFTGWAVRPDFPAASVHLATQNGNTWTPYDTGLPSAAAVAAMPGAGPNQGFAGSFAAPSGVQTFCLWATPTTGPAIQITCATVTVPGAADAVASITSVQPVSGGVSVTGWAVNPAAPTTPTNMALQIGASWFSMPSNLPSTGPLGVVPSAGPNQGFGTTLMLAPNTYSVCVWITEPSGVATNLGCTSVRVFATVLPDPIQRSPRP